MSETSIQAQPAAPKLQAQAPVPAGSPAPHAQRVASAVGAEQIDPIDQFEKLAAQPCGPAVAHPGRDKGKGRALDAFATESTGGGVRLASPPQNPALKASRANSSAEAESAESAAQPSIATSSPSVASTVSEITLENGVLSFILCVPAATGSGSDTKYRISILGGDPTDLEALDPAEMAVHLTEAIGLVQNDPKTKDFKSITFEGRLSDTALAKAIVALDDRKNPQQIIGGNKDEKVFGTERIFSDELEVLLQRMHQALRVRNRRIRIEHLFEGAASINPPPTPTPTIASGVDAANSANSDDQEHRARLKTKTDKGSSSPEHAPAAESDNADGPRREVGESLPSPEHKGS